MEEKRVRIVDIAEELGVSAATVSNVIHGKTKKMSKETQRRVRELLEKRQYVPNMAGLLPAQNSSRIIGIMIHDHEKYEGHVLEDGFVASSLNFLLRETEQAGYFMMVKVTKDCQEIVRFASMWNMEGLVVIGFCEQDYNRLRESIHIPFIIYDGFFKEQGKFTNLTIDHYGGGFQAGAYLKKMGHRRALCIADNDVCMDRERYEGFRTAFGPECAELLVVPMEHRKRQRLYEERLSWIRRFSAVFAASDAYALEFINVVQSRGISVPEEISVIGFDDTLLCCQICPKLTTVRQDGKKRAKKAMWMLQELKAGSISGTEITLPVELVERESVRRY